MDREYYMELAKVRLERATELLEDDSLKRYIPQDAMLSGMGSSAGYVFSGYRLDCHRINPVSGSPFMNAQISTAYFLGQALPNSFRLFL